MKTNILVVICFFAYACFGQREQDLIQAVSSGNFEFVANVSDISHPYKSPLLVALTKGKHDIALLLLEKGARADIEDTSADTPLIIATRNHLLTNRLVHALVCNGAVIEHVHGKTGMTAAMYAAASGNVNGLKILSDFGASFDRINTKNSKSILDYAADNVTFEFLMKSHRYFGKSLARQGYRFIRDEDGMPHVLGKGADGIAYLATNGNQTKVAKFCYNRSLLKKGVVEYEHCKDNEEWFAREWTEWFGNKMAAEEFKVFSLKDLVVGESLFKWMTSLDPEHDFASDSLKAQRVRLKLKKLIIRMLREVKGFVGDFNTSNLLLSEDGEEGEEEWVVIDGHKTVACYSPEDHEWIWFEYCQVSVPVTKESLLEAFKLYAIGPNPTGHPHDEESFGIWLKPRRKGARLFRPSPASKAKLVELINSITVEDLEKPPQ